MRALGSGGGILPGTWDQGTASTSRCTFAYGQPPLGGVNAVGAYGDSAELKAGCLVVTWLLD